MAGSFINRLGTSPEEGIKAPVVATTQVDILLSGVLVVDGYQTVAGDRVLVRSQDDPAQNGIYKVSNTAWSRTTDFNAADDVVNGVLILDANDGDLYRAVMVGSWNPGVTSVTFALVASLTGGLDPGDFIPLIGTLVAAPMTGSIEMSAIGRNWRFGIVGAGIDSMAIIDQIRDGNARMLVSVNDFFTTFESNGDVKVTTVYDGSTAGNVLVTKQYVEDAIGTPQGSFVPLSGTVGGSEITGTLKYSNAGLAQDWTMGYAVGTLDNFTLSTAIVDAHFYINNPTGQWIFNANGQLGMPDIDYSLATGLSAVTKDYVDAQSGGGGAFIPLSGTTSGNEVTGAIEHIDVPGNRKWTIGLTQLPGFEDGLVIAASASSRADGKIWFVTGNASATSRIDENGDFLITTVSATGDISCQGLAATGLIITGGGTVDGRMTIGSAVAQSTYGLNVDHPDGLGVTGDIVCQGLAANGLIVNTNGTIEGKLTVGSDVLETGFDLYSAGSFGVAAAAVMNTVVMNSGQVTGNLQLDLSPSGTGHAANKGYVDGQINTRAPASNTVTTNTSQTVTGAKTFTAGMVANTITLTNTGGLSLVFNDFKGGGTQFLKVTNDGITFASASALAQSEVSGLVATIAALEARLDALEAFHHHGPAN